MKPTLSDLDINRAVRRILVKHWIDIGRVAIRTSNGRIAMFGTLQHLPGVRNELRAENVKALFDEISHINSISRVNARLENWIQDGTTWKACEPSDGPRK